MDTLTTFAPITKFEKLADGSMLVYGKATGTDLDSDLQRCDPDWLSTAMPAWMQWGNVREMHTTKSAGVAVDMDVRGTDYYIKALVVDPVSCDKVEKKALKGFSIGVLGPKISKSIDAPNGLICGGMIHEISLVDRPSLPTAVFELAKSVGGVLTKAEGVGDAPPFTTDEPTGEASAEGETGEGDEAAEIDYIARAREALACWLADEANEVAAGTGGTYVVRLIATLLSDLQWAAEEDAFDDMQVALAAVKTTIFHPAAPQEDPVHITTVAQLVKAASAPEAEEADTVALVELRKALGLDEIDATRAEVTKALEELKELGAEVTKVAGQIEEVRQIIPSTGPVRTRPQADADVAAHRDALLTKAIEYRRTADTVGDRTLAAAYLRSAQELEAQAAQPIPA